MARGGKRKGAGRKPGLLPKKKTWMLKIRPEHARFIVARAKSYGIPIGDFVAISVLYAEQQKTEVSQDQLRKEKWRAPTQERPGNLQSNSE
jgi:hypothetical protein